MMTRIKNKCAICGESGNLILHHLSYDLFWDRKVPDQYLVTLCRSCHVRIHKEYPSVTSHWITNSKCTETIGKKIVYRKEYKIRAVGTGSFKTRVPKILIDRAARKRGLTIEEFIRNYKFVHLYDDFDNLDGAYRFEPIEKEEITLPDVE